MRITDGRHSVRVFVFLFNLVAVPPAAAVEPCGLEWATFLGASGNDRARRVAVGPDGSIFVAGPSWYGADFPEAENDLGLPFDSGDDVVVLRLSGDGHRLLWRAVLAGPSDDWPREMTVDAAGRVVLAGTAGPDFPTTGNAFQPQFGGGDRDGFVAVLDPAVEDPEGQLLYSTYIGGPGDDGAIGAHLDSSGKLVVAGYTSWGNLPTTPGSMFPIYQGGALDAFVLRLDPAASTPEAQLLYSTYFGGSGNEGNATDQDSLRASWGSALASDGSLVLAGHTSSMNLPVAPNAFQPRLAGDFDAFVARIRFEDGTPNTASLEYFSFLGGAVFTLGWLFQTAEEPGCLAAADANADAKVDISDPIYLLAFLFLGGPAPAAPFPGCGPEPQGGALSCVVSCP